jgi:3-hydroxyacyl-CoA dehydrogenase
MGHGIAQVSAQAGYDVVAVETKPEFLERGIARIDGSLGKVFARSVKKGKLTEEAAKQEKDQIMARITTSCSVEAVADCDLVVEAIIENMPLKLDFYKNLKDKVKPDAIFASNTSSLQIGRMADASERADKFVGLHFFNPVAIMKLVEVVKTDTTSPEVLDAIFNFSKNIGKEAVICTDTPGFIVNRLLVPYLASAMALVDRKVASVADVDVSMRLGAGHPMGPLQLADYVGLDTALSILEGWQEEFPEEPAFIVPDSLRSKVAEGNLGRKSGQGFYHWDGDTATIPVK